VPPGTGKTLIAAEAARRLGSQGKKVLLICFTEALAHWLRSEIKQRPDSRLGYQAVRG